MKMLNVYTMAQWNKVLNGISMKIFISCCNAQWVSLQHRWCMNEDYAFNNSRFVTRDAQIAFKCIGYPGLAVLVKHSHFRITSLWWSFDLIGNLYSGPVFTLSQVSPWNKGLWQVALWSGYWVRDEDFLYTLPSCNNNKVHTDITVYFLDFSSCNRKHILFYYIDERNY